MFANVDRKIVTTAVPLVPAYVRANGGVRVRFGTAEGRTHGLERAESGGYRVRFPRNAECCEAVMINTGGGMAEGDRMTVALSLDQGASAVITTQAAEKVYRSQGALTEIDAALHLAAKSRLDWLPQETILFSGARWRRRLAVGMAADASLTVAESIVFGRIAMDEAMGPGFCHDRWRVTRGGTLVFAEDLRLDGHLADLFAPHASGKGARALATILHVAPDAEGRIDEARALLGDVASECGASAWNGMLLIRLLSDDPQALRNDLVGVLEKFRHGPMPRSW